MTGNITRRGEHSWRLKFDIGRDPKTGKRLTRYATVKGTKKQAQAELARLVSEHHAGTYVEPTKVTVADYLRQWVDNAEVMTISPKTAERYRQLIDHQIIPHLGKFPLQKLKVNDLATWHATLLKTGRVDGEGLSARTVGHAHRVLGKALADAVKREIIVKNPAALIAPPKVQTEEMAILASDQVKDVLTSLRETPIYAEVLVLLTTGMRRGELMGLRWGDIDFDANKIRIERSIEVTKAHGLRIKTPKTRSGRRLISMPASAAEVLREHRKKRLEIRVALGLGKLPDDHHVFGHPITGEPEDPRLLTTRWRGQVAARKLPKVTLHALRHSHASALIASGMDPVTVSRRLGHANPNVTLGVYAHLFDRSDERAAEVIDAVLKK